MRCSGHLPVAGQCHECPDVLPCFVKAPVGRKKPRCLEEGEQVEAGLHMWLSCPVWASGVGGWARVAASQSRIPKLICLVFTEPLSY